MKVVDSSLKRLMVWIVVSVAFGFTGAVFAQLVSEPAWEKAEWIGYTQDDRVSAEAERPFQTQNMKQAENKRTSASPLLRKTFTVEKSVRSAQVLVCGLGLHELYLNGRKVGERMLEPAPTSYDRLSLYNVHDVTETEKFLISFFRIIKEQIKIKSYNT